MSVDLSLRHRFGSFALDVTFSAPAGLTALFGRSGAGKTTIINAVAGLLRPDEAVIAVAGRRLVDTSSGLFVPRHRRRVGYVFQESRLFPHLTVRQNLHFGRLFSRGAQPAPDDIIDMLALAPLLERRPATLSGGEKQRVAIGRALLAGPTVLLMDEPLASLDEPRKAEILPFIERLRDEAQVPILYVSHSLAEVARLATTIVALSEGKVARLGAAADVLADPTAFPVLGRQEAGAIVAARVRAHAEADGLTELEIGAGRLWTPRITAAPGTRLRVRIRARDIMLSDRPPEGLSALNVLPAAITAIGDREAGIVDVVLACGPDRLLARVTTRSLSRLGLEVGSPCYAVLKSIAVGRRDLGQPRTGPE